MNMNMNVLHSQSHQGSHFQHSQFLSSLHSTQEDQYETQHTEASIRVYLPKESTLSFADGNPTVQA